MPKKKSKSKVRKKRGAPTGVPPLTTQQQFAPIHNQALKNLQRDANEAERISQAQEKEFKMDTLKLQRELIEKKLSLL